MNITLKSEEEYHNYIQNHKATPNANEVYCAIIYVKQLPLMHRKFPICIQKRKPPGPDFELQIGEIKIGLEHTRASCQTLTYAVKKVPEGGKVEIPDCEHIPASKKFIDKVIREPNEPLKSVGFGDWGAEKFLIKPILNSIKEKTKKLNQNYEIFPSNELIVYDNILIPGMRWDYVMSELEKQYIKIDGRNFDKIHLVVEHNQLKYDIMSKCD